jgi:predicted glycoside hydrolase/deacetylase ChbG (UPF0249 family)
LIVNADDFGRTASLTQGIVAGHREGIVTSTSTMVNFAPAEAGVRTAIELTPNLGVGIHLNLTAGRPVLQPSQVPDLVRPDGSFYPIREAIPRIEVMGDEQILAEMQAQVEVFRSWGREPTHLDCHHHLLYLSPRLFEILVQIAQQYSLPIRYPWHQGEPAADMDELARAHRIDPARLPAIMTACDEILDRSGLQTPDRCILSFYGPGATLENLLAVISGLPEGVSEMMCHPGLADRALREESTYAVEREQELEILCHPGVQAALKQASVTLVDFAALI